jgi:DNA modification methylase
MSEPIKWTNVTLKLSDLKKWENNPAEISKDAAGRLVECFNEFGQIETLAVDPENRLVDGHQRLDTWLAKYGDIEVDCRKASRLLTEKERQKIAVMLRSGAVGRYNWDVVSGWNADDLQGWGMDSATLKEWKHDVSALDNFIESEKKEPVDAEPQIDRAAELNEKWQVKTGDLWQIGEHRLLCGDSTKREDVDLLMQGEIANITVTDPPYGMDLDTDYSKLPSTKQEGNKNYSRVIDDDKPFDYALIAKIATKEAFWFGADYYAKTIPDNGSWLIWDKRVDDKFDAMIGSAFETIWSEVKHKREIIRCNNTLFSGEQEAKNKLHPTQKPTKVIQWIISKYSQVDELVIDYFAGSGTCFLACENLHRKCRAIEISPNYCAVILQRMEEAFGIVGVRIDV